MNMNMNMNMNTPNLHHQIIFYYYYFIFSILIISFFDPITCYSNTQTRHYSNVKGMFVFGSSLVDNGNNNFLANLAKADFFPYGIDFPLGASGRFCNGKNVIDLIGNSLNLPFIPPFKNPFTKGTNISYGVNFASGASGILAETGSIAGDVLSLDEQIQSFEEFTVPELEVLVGMRSTESLPKYIFVVGSGGNDYTLNYFPMKDIKYANVTVEAFTANLTATLSLQIKMLYKLGARKFVVMSLNPLGCSPGVLATEAADQGGCVGRLNRAAHLFNINLKIMVDTIRPQMPGSTLVMVNAYKIIRDIIKNPASLGFRDVSNSCCEVLPRNEGGTGILCKRGGSSCSDRTAHVYFDGLHPTEAVNVVIATKAYDSNLPTEVYPFNIKRLANI